MSDKVYSEMWRAIGQGSSWCGEILNRAKDGSSYWVEANVEPDLNENGEIIGYTAIQQNITDKKQIEALSSTDYLTGLYNRKKVDDIFELELERARRYEKPLSVILCDLDNFKQINDGYGHQVGDEVLIGIARLILSSVRVTDFAGRWGGEEFMIICPESDLNQALRVAEKLRMEIELQPFSAVGQRTSSFGVACFVLGDDIDAMLKRADDALYRAKRCGRNRVEAGISNQ